MLIAAVFEFLGAMLLGGAVTRTIAGGIANAATFTRYPALFLYGKFALGWSLPSERTYALLRFCGNWQLIGASCSSCAVFRVILQQADAAA